MSGKSPVKGSDGRETGRKRGLCDDGAFFQKAAGMLDSQTVDKIREADIHAFPENMGNMVFT